VAGHGTAPAVVRVTSEEALGPVSGPAAPSPEVDEARFWALHRLALVASETPRTWEGVRRIEAALEALQEPGEGSPERPEKRAPVPEDP
jgi:hypothetical protein